MSIIENLITNRNAADVSRLSAIGERIKKRTATEEEVKEWLAGMRGAYNVSDIERVEEAVAFVSEYINSLQQTLDGYRESYGVASDSNFVSPLREITVNPVGGWTREEIPSPERLTLFLNTVKAFAETNFMGHSLPETLEKLTTEGANEIERVIVAQNANAEAIEAEKKKLIYNTSLSWKYSGEIFAGEAS